MDVALEEVGEGGFAGGGGCAEVYNADFIPV